MNKTMCENGVKTTQTAMTSSVYSVWARHMRLFTPQMLCRAAFPLFMAGVMPLAHAATPMSDDELDTKYLDVPAKAVLIHKSNDAKASANTQTTMPSVPAVTLDPTQINATQVPGAMEQSLLLSGLNQQLRTLGTSDLSGVTAAISNSAQPPAFGTENFSLKWAGNLNEVFTPPPNNLDFLRSIYGDDAEFYFSKPVNISIEVSGHHSN